VNAVTWAVRAFFGVVAAFWAVIGAFWVREWFQRAGRVIEDTRAFDDAIEILCDPCHGHPGKCRCKRKCPHPLCGAGETIVSDEQFSRELAEWLKGDGR
jgi:hypothetical protein